MLINLGFCAHSLFSKEYAWNELGL